MYMELWTLLGSAWASSHAHVQMEAYWLVVLWLTQSAIRVCMCVISDWRQLWTWYLYLQIENVQICTEYCETSI
jgi:hypothetical protein